MALAPPTRFTGYSPPGSNTTYTPNQFFDVVLPNSSRGVVRIVGYMLRRILGWSDANGNPVHSQVSFTYSDLIEQANVSRSMIKDALNEAIANRFIRCVREPQPKSSGQNAVNGVYELKWSDDVTYIKDLEQFRGFYSGNGNLTNIPNDFFDYTVREETLSVIRVVGAIARNTIGFQTNYGFRRQEVQASMSRLHHLTGITSRDQLSEAVQDSVRRGHLVRVVDGRFEAGSSKDSVAAVYALRWKDGITPLRREGIKDDDQKKFAPERSDRKSPAVEHQTQHIDPPLASIRKPDRGFSLTPALITTEIGSKTGPSGEFGGNGSVRNTDRGSSEHRYENRTENGLRTGPASVRKPDRDRFEKRTDIEITDEITTLNNNSKPPAVAGYELLLKAGFDERGARDLASQFDAIRIARQIELLPKRKPSTNPLGLLRRAIEQDWPSPLTARLPVEPARPKRSCSDTDQAYQEYLLSRSAQLRSQDLQLLDEFEARDRELRANLENSNMISANVRERILQEYCDESRRTRRWIDFAVAKKRLTSHAVWLRETMKKAG